MNATCWDGLLPYTAAQRKIAVHVRHKPCPMILENDPWAPRGPRLNAPAPATRNQIASYVARHLYCTAKEISVELKTAHALVCNKLAVLVKDGQVAREKVDGFWRYKSLTSKRQPESIRVQVLKTLIRSPGLTVKEIAEKLKCNPHRVSAALCQAKPAKQVEMKGEHGERVFYATPATIAKLKGK